MRVYELATKLNIDTKTLIKKLRGMNIKVKNHMSSLSTDEIRKVEKKISPPKEKKAKKTKPKKRAKKVSVVKKTTPKKLTKKRKAPKKSGPKVLIQEIIEKPSKKAPREPIVEEKEIPVSPGAVESKVTEEVPAPPIIEKPKLPMIKIDQSITVSGLAGKLNIKVNELIKKLMDLGILATINQRLDIDTATLAAHEFGYEVEVIPLYGEELLKEEVDKKRDLHPRSPVVTIMGHVDHGKTSLLDAIRESKITAKESGGITQHIGAYKIVLGDDKGSIVFLDTPGHEAFTAMRARGTQVTDIVVLVVAADDGVMPQTIEAIDHARAARAPILVVINKIDLPNANPQKVKEGLAQYNLVPEEWGGKTIVVEVSAKEKVGLDELLEMIHLQAELLELKANPSRKAVGTVIEAKLDKRRGPVGTILIQKGTLQISDAFISSFTAGKVKAMIDEHGKKLKDAGPSTPVEILGFYDLPHAGDSFQVVDSEQIAKMISSQRKLIKREEELSQTQRVTLEDLHIQMKKGVIKELNLIIKADVRGSVEALCDSLEKLSTSEIKTNIIHSGVGGINDSDVILAEASNCIIIGYNVRPSLTSEQLAKKGNVDIHTYRVIYEAVEDIKKAMEGLLEPEYKEKMLGRALIKKLFKVPKVGTVAGCLVESGKILRNSKARVLRNDRIIHEGKISSLKHFKDDVREIGSGNECGIGLENFNDLKESDVIEPFELEKIARKL